MKNIVLLLFINILMSCSNTAKTVYSYSGENEIYPVVINVFEKNNIVPQTIDIINNEITSHFIYETNFGAKIRYKLKVLYKNYNIIVELYNIQQYSFSIDDWWFIEDRLSYFDEYKLSQKIADEINIILNNQKKYQFVKNKVYNYFLFHYLVIKDLSKKETGIWIKKHMLGRRYDLKVTLSDFKKNNTGKLPGMKYIAEFTAAGESSFNDFFVIHFFTNNEKYFNINNKTQLRILGRISKSFDIADILIKTSHIYLVEN